MKTLSDRIKAALTQSGISQADLVRATGAKAASVSNWVGGRTKNLKGANLVNAARVLGVEEAWLANGVGPMKKIEEEDLALPSSEHMAIRMVDAKASAGLGHVVLSTSTNKHLMFRRDWLARHGVRNDEDALAFEVEGDSMVDKHILPGAIVVANRRRRDPTPQGLFVVWIDGKLYVKKMVQHHGKWLARSCNKARAEIYPDVPITSEDDRIVGKAFWCGFGL
ncbi:hypothetical protein A9G00_08385 [Achromobacter xylosoxidans]|nr:hypothetical protein A9G00_08385 [Achromobacter xylosoxidans]